MLVWVQVPPAVLQTMAAQKKPHSPNQLQNLANKRKCSSCGFASYRVLESRKISDGVRRRYICERCTHRETLYEINSDAYSDLITLRSKFNKLLSVFSGVKFESQSGDSGNVLETSKCPCEDCYFYHDTLTDEGFKCSYELPEAGTLNAVGCNLFENF